jgi:hypothetical protein
MHFKNIKKKILGVIFYTDKRYYWFITVYSLMRSAEIVGPKQDVAKWQEYPADA